MNLVRLSDQEIREFSKKVGDIHDFKSDIMKTSRDLDEFDLYKDIDSRDKDVYVALRRNVGANHIYSGYSLY